MRIPRERSLRAELDHLLAHAPSGQRRQELERIHRRAVRQRMVGHDLLPGLDDGQLAPLEAVPRVIGVLVVGTEDRQGQLLGRQTPLVWPPRPTRRTASR